MNKTKHKHNKTKEKQGCPLPSDLFRGSVTVYCEDAVKILSLQNVVNDFVSLFCSRRSLGLAPVFLGIVIIIAAIVAAAIVVVIVAPPAAVVGMSIGISVAFVVAVG